MQRRELIAMMNQRRVEGLGDSDELAALAGKYPYCSTFQVLKAIGLKEADSIDLSAQLNRAAIAIYDRSNLYDYIVKDRLLQRIEEADVASEIPATAAGVNDPALADAESDVEGDRVGEESADLEADKKPTAEKADTVLKSDEMEAEIMREAITHIGEMEAQLGLESPTSDRNLSAAGAGAESDGFAKTEEDNGGAGEPMTFGKWLLTKDKEKAEKSESEGALINRFIQETPQISPVTTEFFSPHQMGKLSLVDDESFVTETLAGIYARQGAFKKAARAYQNLRLKYPKKSTYFAALQKKAEDQIK